MTEQELSIRLEEHRSRQASWETAGDGGVHSMDEVLRELMAAYQPLNTRDTACVPQLAAC